MMRSLFTRMSVAGAVLAVLTLSACNNFQQQSNIEDLRVIAVRTEPAEIFYSPLHVLLPPDARPFGFRLPDYEVDVEVWAFDPRGGLMQTTVSLCPPDEDSTCRFFEPEERIERAPENIQDALRALYQPDPVQAVLTDDDLAKDPAGRIPGMTQTWDFSADVIDSLLYDENGNAGLDLFPIYPKIAVRAEALEAVEVNEERAYKRLPLTLNYNDPDLPPEFKDLIFDILGAEPCDVQPTREEFVEGRTDCFFTRPANTNPTLVGFNLLPPEQEVEPEKPIAYSDVADLEPKALLEVTPGSRVHLEPVFPEDVREMYQIFSFDLDDGTLVLENRFEDLSINWFKTGGSAPASSQPPQFGGTFDVIWELPSNRGPGERDTLVAVIRDQRGGVAVGEIVVQYR
jgi:hypothetical protein